MFKLDNNLLLEIGLGALPEHEKNGMLRHIYETLEMRVGYKLAEQMSNEQLDEFERFIDGDITYAQNYLNQIKPNWQQGQEFLTQVRTAQEAAARANAAFNVNPVISEFAALTWLETNFPSYKQVVAAELEILKAEIRQHAPQILAASQNTAAQAAAMPPMPAPAPAPMPTPSPMPAPLPSTPVPAQPAYTPQDYAPQAPSQAAPYQPPAYQPPPTAAPQSAMPQVPPPPPTPAV